MYKLFVECVWRGANPCRRAQSVAVGTGRACHGLCCTLSGSSTAADALFSLRVAFARCVRLLVGRTHIAEDAEQLRDAMSHARASSWVGFAPPARASAIPQGAIRCVSGAEQAFSERPEHTSARRPGRSRHARCQRGRRAEAHLLLFFAAELAQHKGGDLGLGALLRPPDADAQPMEALYSEDGRQKAATRTALLWSAACGRLRQYPGC
jgi:hypothetical protein